MTEPAPVKLDELYQEVILDHNKKPRNFKKLDAPTAYAHGVNPLCGDDYELFLKVDADAKVVEIGFQGSGCAISKSSASLMTTMVEGKSVEEAKRLQGHFVDLLTRDKIDLSDREGVGLLKMKYLPWEQAPALLRLQRELKRLFDPLDLLNPGKIIPEAT